MQQRLSSQAFEAFRQEIGEPFGERLRDHLKAFEDPRLAVQQEVESIYSLPFAPADLVVHGLVYDLGSGSIEVIINGYDATHRGRHITS
jgi:carbonic anhydrase